METFLFQSACYNWTFSSCPVQLRWIITWFNKACSWKEQINDIWDKIQTLNSQKTHHILSSHVSCRLWLMSVMNILIAKFMGPTWGPPGSCWPQMGPMLAPWTLLSGYVGKCVYCEGILTNILMDVKTNKQSTNLKGTVLATDWHLRQKQNDI